MISGMDGLSSYNGDIFVTVGLKNKKAKMISLKDFTYDLARELLSHGDELGQQEGIPLSKDGTQHRVDTDEDNNGKATRNYF